MTTPIDPFERRLPDALADLASARTPDYLIDILGQTARKRQRPAWATPGRWNHMSGLTSRPAIVAMVAIVLVALVGGGILLNGRDQPAVGGPSVAPTGAPSPAPSATPAALAPTLIWIQDSEPRGRPSNTPLVEFAAKVKALSSGTMEVRFKLDEGPSTATFDAVSRGDVQVGVIPARSWSTTGVTSFKGLQAPFIVESTEHLAAIVNDPQIGTQVLSGLPSSVKGLILYPEALRHFLSFTDPILKPSDIAGRQIRTISALESEAMIKALGGQGIHPRDDESDAPLITNGTITGADTDFGVAMDSLPKPGIITANLVLAPELDAMVVNAAFWDSLTQTQQSVLNEAATATRVWALANQPTEAVAAAAYCADGGSVVLADQASLDAFRAATTAFTTELSKDSVAKSVIDRVKALSPGTPTNVKACGTATP